MRPPEAARTREPRSKPLQQGASLLAALLVAFLASCSRPREIAVHAEGPILIISIDTLRSDHLPAYGYHTLNTPAMDALRADSILFTHAWSHCPLTLPSHTTILTGRLPSETGMHDNAGFRLKDDIPTLAEVLKKAGFATGGAVSSYALRGTTGISRGFDFYDDHFAPTAASTSIGDVQRAGTVTEKLAEQWIGTHATRPFLFFLHLYEPHAPYTPPEPFRSRYRSPYDGEIAYTDSIVGDFLSFLKAHHLYDNATIVLLSDHGEGLGEHGEDEHGILLYREALQVPLMVKLPRGASRNTTVEANAQLVDIFPTLTALAGLSPPSSSGTSLLTLSGQNRSRTIISETYFPRLHLGWNDLHSAISSASHLIRGSKSELFDLRIDPNETHDISHDERRTFSMLSAALDPYAVPINIREQITPEESRKLASLGYIGSASPGSEELPDPRDHIAAFREIRKARAYFEHGLYRESVEATMPLLTEFPKLEDLWQLQAEAFNALGRNEEAIQAAKRALAIDPGAEQLVVLLADLYFRTGDNLKARQYAELALRKQPASAHDILARVALAGGDLDGATAQARASLTADRDSAAALWTLGRIALSRNDPAGALTQFDEALRVATRTARPLRSLQHDRGFALMNLGRDREAEAAFCEEIRLFPDESYAYKNLIVFYIAHRRFDESTALIRKLLAGDATPESYAVVADALATTGNATGASAVARDGLRRYPGNTALLPFTVRR